MTHWSQWARERARLDARDAATYPAPAPAPGDAEWCSVCGERCACATSFRWSVDCQVCKYLHDLEPKVRVQHTEAHEAPAAVARLPIWYRTYSRAERPKETTTMRATEDGRAIMMTQREAAVARRYGFTAEDLTEVSRKEFVRNVAATEERNAAVDAVESQFNAVGREFGLSPQVYSERQRIGVILARRGLLGGETYGSGRR